MVVQPGETLGIEAAVDFCDCPRADRTYAFDLDGDGVFEVSGRLRGDIVAVEGAFTAEGWREVRGRVSDAYGATYFSPSTRPASSSAPPQSTPATTARPGVFTAT